MIQSSQYKKINNSVGWVVGLMAMLVYFLTLEPKGSFFDCGEFLSCGYKLQVTHPPGYPMFVLLARIFAIFGGNNPQQAAWHINSMSAVVSGLTIMFLFWTISRISFKIVFAQNKATQVDMWLVIKVMIASGVGALGFAFTDTFWFSAVEAEVYALSLFFTAMVFWAVLKWEDGTDSPVNDRWIIFIFYLVGIAIGVHLMNLLVIPTLVLVYYYKKYTYSFKSFLCAIGIGGLLTFAIQIIFIQYTVWWAGYTDLFFVNELNLPFFSGFTFFYLCLLAFLFYLNKLSIRKKYRLLQISVWSMIFMLIGYSTYLTSVVRADTNIPINMFKVNNPMALVSYLGRDQYDDAPLLFGPDYIETPSRKPKRDIILKENNKYVYAGKLFVQDWNQTQTAHIFPRMFNSANDNFQSEVYAYFTGIQKGDAPTLGDNFKFFFNYQIGWMFLRYLAFNFIGRENDLIGYGNVRDGNYLSGISFIDNWRLVATQKLPDTIGKKNKAHNTMFYLPFIMGVLGIWFLFKQHRKLFWILGLFFVYTSLATIVFLNLSGHEAREIDYIYVGAFYVFAIWIGIGVIYLMNILQKKLSVELSIKLGGIIAILAVPVLLIFQEYDDHDRSKKTLAYDMARNYLISCPKDALLFIFNDNDLYPLLYAQEVEGIRTDVRIVSNNLSKASWHVTRLLQKENLSMPFDILFKPEQIHGGKRNVIFYRKMAGYDDSTYYPLEQVFRQVVANDSLYFDLPTNSYPLFTEEFKANVFPCYRFYVDVDKSYIRKQGWVEPTDSLVSRVTFNYNRERNEMIKNEIWVYALIAANHWKRPICFTSKYSLNDLGIQDYLVQKGMIYQLLPTPKKTYNTNETFRLITTEYGFGNPSLSNVYFDNENREQFKFIKIMISEFCHDLISKGKFDSANKVLTYFDSKINAEATPYGVTNFNNGNQYNYYSFRLLEAAYRLKNKKVFDSIAAQLQLDMKQQFDYYLALGDLNKNDLLYQAELSFQGRENQLSKQQIELAIDILGSNKMVEDIIKMRNTW
ncbi:MAG: DUF2723 domain-containing protein [Alphaproteobacteria bacterium]|nr:DUF2723 domain-containing protein [Alphaproteobacteria bacterium]